ncbi:MAG: hypothetical protein A3I83_02430 [Methylotenera sp. RIFCSPLOWO2_02_FULL_45_14]|nr:MAG: hypothetical protein A3I83_02430 [Methylotenera sp. RIFCSPLOWO2_02_FULL_45_14]
MELLKVTQINANNPIPVFGIESDIESNQESSTEDRCSRIAICAYYKAEARGFEPGHEIEDWLAAETEVD